MECIKMKEKKKISHIFCLMSDFYLVFGNFGKFRIQKHDIFSATKYKARGILVTKRRTHLLKIIFEGVGYIE